MFTKCTSQKHISIKVYRDDNDAGDDDDMMTIIIIIIIIIITVIQKLFTSTFCSTMDDEDYFQPSSGSGLHRSNNAPEVILSANISTSGDNVTDTYDSGDYSIFADKLVEDAYKLNIYPLETTLLGIVRPILILMTALTNAFVVGFFLLINNRRKSSSLLFVSIAVSDSLTGLVLLPNSFYVYAGESALVSKSWCLFYMISKFYASRAFHTVSVWQTVLLSVQRLLCVRYPFITKRLCTFWKTAVIILIVYICAFGLHIYHVLNNDRKTLNGVCGFFVENPCSQTCIYLLASIIVQNLLPSLLLVGLTIITLWSLCMASKRVSRMSLSTSPGAITRSSRDRVVTVTSILIVIVFLIPELPFGIYKYVYVIYSPDSMITSLELHHQITAIYEVALVFSFHINFWIYCGTMGDFRQAILDLCGCGRRRNRHSGGKFSRSSFYRNGSARTNVSRTSSGTSRKRVLSNTTSVLSTASDFFIHPAGSATDTRFRKEEIGKVPTENGANMYPIDITIDGNKNEIANDNSPGIDEISVTIQPNEPEKNDQTDIAGREAAGDERNDGKKYGQTRINDQGSSDDTNKEETPTKTVVSPSDLAYLPMNVGDNAKPRLTVYHQ